MDLVLRVPGLSEEAEFLRAHRATSPGDRNFLHHYEEGMSFRRYYATAILRHALQIALQQLGLTRVLVTCDDDNVGSIKTIEKNGGVLDSIVTGRDGDTPKRRYWIATAD